MSKIGSKTLAELEADLFLAERAFKRVPSDENEQALATVKEAYEALQEGKDVIADQKPVVNNTAAPAKPAAPKPSAPKPAAKAPAKAPAKPAATPAAPTNTDDSKKN